MAERLTAAADVDGLLALTALLGPAFRKTAYLLWKVLSLTMAFSFRCKIDAVIMQDAIEGITLPTIMEMVSVGHILCKITREDC